MVTKATERRARLTKRTVDASKPEGARYIVWDESLAGFGLRVEPTGRKTFIARYRAGGGRTGVRRQATLGRYGALTVEEARTNARRLLGKAAGGSDPVGDQQRARQAGITVGEICDWYLKAAENGRLLGRMGRPIKASTLATDRMRIEAHVRPLMGRKAAQALGVADFEGMQADIAAGKTAVKRPSAKTGKRRRGGLPKGGAGTAGRTLGMLRAILEHAARSGLLASNPARGVRKLASGKRKKRLSLGDIRALGNAMCEAERDGESPTGLAAIRLTLLTGLRRSETLGMHRDWLLPAGGIDFPDTKSGPQVRPIGRIAVKLLQRRFDGNNQAWAFPSDHGNGHFVGLPKVLERVCKRANLTGITPHVLRHSFASIAAELGFSELVIAGLLGHSAGSVTAGYVHLDSALASAADRVAETIAAALDGRQEAEVVALRKVVRATA